MEPLLAGVTFVSLALASFMTLVAWNLLREKRDRTAAQSEALAAMAFAGLPDASAESSADDGDDMAEDWDRALRARPTSEAEDLRLAGPTTPFADASRADDLFRASDPPRTGSGRWLALAAVALIMAAGVATAYALRTPEVAAAVRASRITAETTSAAAAPLELLRLSHLVDADGEFVLTGVVQNPSAAPARQGVAAVVNLLDGKGELFATGRAVLAEGALAAGQEVRFEIRIPRAAGVTRYRIGFRHNPDNVVVEHIDRREQAATPTAVDGSASSTPSDVRDAPSGLGRRSEG
jgi:hypothetical protein